MLPNGRRLGAHFPLAAGMVRAADRAAAIGASAMQVFVDNPTSWRRRATPPAELPAFLERLAAHGISPLSVHAPYLVNLAGPDKEIWDRSVDLMVNELRVASTYGAAFINLHIGSHRGAGTEVGTKQLAQGLRRILEAAGDRSDGGDDVALVLENGAGAGFSMGSTPEELGAIAGAFTAAGVPRGRVGFCLDTAHLWGAGVPIGTAAGVDALVAEFDALVGLDRLQMVHLNDSRAEAGTGSDRHEHLGGGRIGTDGLARFLTHPGLAHVTYIIETPGMEEGWDEVNLDRARDLAAGRALAPLPAAAFHTRSARGRGAPPDEDGDEHDGRGGAPRPADGAAARR